MKILDWFLTNPPDWKYMDLSRTFLTHKMLPNSSVFTIRFQALMITKRNGIRILRVQLFPIINNNNHIYSAICTTCIIQLFVGWTYHKYTTKNSISAVMLLAILPSHIIVVKWYLVRIVSLQFFLTCTSKSNLQLVSVPART